MDNHTNLADNDVVDSVRSAATRVLPMDSEQIDEIADRVRELDERARSFIRRNPTATVLGAVAVGFLVGRLLSR